VPKKPRGRAAAKLEVPAPTRDAIAAALAPLEMMSDPNAGEAYRHHFQRHPVIFMSFKDLIGNIRTKHMFKFFGAYFTDL
jgi:hypothetical protein